MNKEYIDKYEAYLLLKQKAETYMLPATKEAYEKAAILIGSIKACDVQPVRHGRWVVSDTQRHVEITYECSECQHEVVGEYEKTPFCGECGARMDGDNE